MAIAQSASAALYVLALFCFAFLVASGEPEGPSVTGGSSTPDGGGDDTSDSYVDPRIKSGKCTAAELDDVAQFFERKSESCDGYTCLKTETENFTTALADVPNDVKHDEETVTLLAACSCRCQLMQCEVDYIDKNGSDSCKEETLTYCKSQDEHFVTRCTDELSRLNAYLPNADELSKSFGQLCNSCKASSEGLVEDIGGADASSSSDVRNESVMVDLEAVDNTEAELESAVLAPSFVVSSGGHDAISSNITPVPLSFGEMDDPSQSDVVPGDATPPLPTVNEEVDSASGVPHSDGIAPGNEPSSSTRQDAETHSGIEEDTIGEVASNADGAVDSPGLVVEDVDADGARALNSMLSIYFVALVAVFTTLSLEIL